MATTAADARALAGRVAVVTGGGSGLGAEVARGLARAGAAVVVTGRRAEPLDDTAKAIADDGGRAAAVAGDVSDPATARAVVAAARERFGGVDVLVNNAGLHAEPDRVHEVAIEDFDRFVAVNLRGPFLMMREAVPEMLARGGGAIVNVASVFGLVGLKYAASYCATKGGVVQLTRAAALDYGADGIRVNCLCPGLMEPVERRHTTPEQRARLLEGWLGAPIEQAAATRDVAELVLFLAGPASAAMTGAIIPIDGGYSAQ